MSHTTRLTNNTTDAVPSASASASGPASVSAPTYALDTQRVLAENETTFATLVANASPAYDEVEALDADPYTPVAQERRYPLEVITDERDQQHYEALGLPAQDWCGICDAPSNITCLRDAVESVVVDDELYTRLLTVVEMACGHTTTENH